MSIQPAGSHASHVSQTATSVQQSSATAETSHAGQSTRTEKPTQTPGTSGPAVSVTLSKDAKRAAAANTHTTATPEEE